MRLAHHMNMMDCKFFWNVNNFLTSNGRGYESPKSRKKELMASPWVNFSSRSKLQLEICNNNVAQMQDLKNEHWCRSKFNAQSRQTRIAGLKFDACWKRWSESRPGWELHMPPRIKQPCHQAWAWNPCSSVSLTFNHNIRNLRRSEVTKADAVRCRNQKSNILGMSWVVIASFAKQLASWPLL